MDPDMVRQQEEAEYAQMTRPAAGQGDKADAILPDTKPVKPLPAFVVSAMPELQVDAPKRETPARPDASKWPGLLQLVFGGAALSGLGALTGTAFGANHGLPQEQQLWLGVGAALASAILYAALKIRVGSLNPVVG